MISQLKTKKTGRIYGWNISSTDLHAAGSGITAMVAPLFGELIDDWASRSWVVL